MGLTFTNEVRDRYIDDANFQGRDSSRDIDPLEQILRDYAFERFGQGGPDLVLLIGRENVDDSVDCLRSARGVEGSENQMSRCRCGQGQFDRLEITHFTDEENVRIFAQGTAQGGCERTRVHTNFSMLHQAILAAMHKFYRILDCDDVIAPLDVRVIHHCRQSGRLAGTGRPGDKDQPLL